MTIVSASATLRLMNVDADPGGNRDRKYRQYLAISLQNPILRWSAWLLFILLVIRLTYVGPRGPDLPEPGERATSYYLAQRGTVCKKPNPNYPTLVEKAREGVLPVYTTDNTHLEARERQLRSIEDSLAATLRQLNTAERALSDFQSRASGKRPIKESPFYRNNDGGKKGSSALADVDSARIAEKKEEIRQLRETAQRLISSAATGISPKQQRAIVDTLVRDESLLHNIFDAAYMSFAEVRRWLVVEAADFVFQRDRTNGIIVAETGTRLDSTQRVLSYVDAVDQVRKDLVDRIVRGSYPSLVEKGDLINLVKQIVVGAVRSNFHKDRVRTEEAVRVATSRIPMTEDVSFEQGQTVVAMGDVVEEWKRDCIAQMYERNTGEKGMGDLFGIPIPTLLLLIGISFLAVLAAAFLRSFSLKVFGGGKLADKDYLSIGVLIVLHLGLTRLFLLLAEVFSLTYPDLNRGTLLTACPVALSTMLINTLLGARTAFLSALFMTSMTTVITVSAGPDLLSGNFPAYYALYLMSVALSGIWVTKRVAKRGGLFVAGMVSGITGIVFWTAIYLVEGAQAPLSHGVQLALASLVSGALSYVFLISLSPIFEYVWDYTTESRLLELASSDHPALKELARKAPGTYQHSLWISALVEDAAERIRANPLLAKVGAYYHDLGKLVAAEQLAQARAGNESPLYFAENQVSGTNPHDYLPPEVSARVIRHHVEQSVAMIKKYRLGKRIMDIAAQHHGTTLMEHFYNRALNQAREGEGTVNQADFRYPGPKPQTKEAGLIMLADSVEAAVRALPQHTEEKISERVWQIIERKVTDAQLDESGLTYGDVRSIAESFIKTLVSMYHARPEYTKAGDADEKTVRMKRGTFEVEDGVDETLEDRETVLSAGDDRQDTTRLERLPELSEEPDKDS